MRIWLHERLLTLPNLATHLPSGIRQASSLEGTPQKGRFAVTRMGRPSSRIRDNNVTKAMATVAYVTVHDRPGNYEGIDAALVAICAHLETAPPSTVYGFVQARFLDESDDLPIDTDLGTISRIARYQLIHRTA